MVVIPCDMLIEMCQVYMFTDRLVFRLSIYLTNDLPFNIAVCFLYIQYYVPFIVAHGSKMVAVAVDMRLRKRKCYICHNLLTRWSYNTGVDYWPSEEIFSFLNPYSD